MLGGPASTEYLGGPKCFGGDLISMGGPPTPVGTQQMVKVLCRSMHWLPHFGPKDVIIFAQNRNFVN